MNIEKRRGEMSDFQVLERNRIGFAAPHENLAGFFPLEHWVVEDNGVKDDQVIWKRGDFVLIAALDKNGQLIVIRQLKKAVELELLCIPAGGVKTKKGESPEEAALRELFEETGYFSLLENCTVMGPFYNSPDKSTEKQWVVVVEGAEYRGHTELEGHEGIRSTAVMDLNEAKRQLKVGLHLLTVYLVEDFIRSRSSASAVVAKAS